MNQLHSVLNAAAAETSDGSDSIFRSGGQTKVYPPSPRITTARPQSPKPTPDRPQLDSRAK